MSYSVGASVSKDIHDAMWRLAESRGRTIGSIVRELVERELAAAAVPLPTTGLASAESPPKKCGLCDFRDIEPHFANHLVKVHGIVRAPDDTPAAAPLRPAREVAREQHTLKEHADLWDRINDHVIIWQKRLDHEVDVNAPARSAERLLTAIDAYVTAAILADRAARPEVGEVEMTCKARRDGEPCDETLRLMCPMEGGHDARCESGCPDPVTHHDDHGVPLCEACWKACLEDGADLAADRRGDP